MDVEIRVATEADGPVLADIERNAPLAFGEESMVIDRGDDYFAAERLMEDATVLLATLDGEPAGVFCGAVHEAMLGGERRRMMYIHHARILPRFQRTGLGRAFGGKLDEIHKGRFEARYWYISPGNARSQGFASQAQNKWSFGPLMVELDARANAGPPLGRTATPGDAPRIVEMLNALHGGEEMFVPYTVERLEARLTRAAGQYGWGQLWVTDGAVAGAWAAGDAINAWVRAADGSTREQRETNVLDYGCLPGGENELRGLLRAWCGWTAERGWDTVQLFTSPGSRSRSLVEGLECEVSPFDFWTPPIPEPDGAAGRGLYVDPVHF